MNFLIIFILHYLKDSDKSTEIRERKGEIFYLLAYSLNTYKRQSWTKLKPEARSQKLHPCLSFALQEPKNLGHCLLPSKMH